MSDDGGDTYSDDGFEDPIPALGFTGGGEEGGDPPRSAVYSPLSDGTGGGGYDNGAAGEEGEDEGEAKSELVEGPPTSTGVPSVSRPRRGPMIDTAATTTHVIERTLDDEDTTDTATCAAEDGYPAQGSPMGALFMMPYNPMGDVVEAQAEAHAAEKEAAAKAAEMPPVRTVAEQLALVPKKSGLKKRPYTSPPPEEFMSPAELQCMHTGCFDSVDGTPVGVEVQGADAEGSLTSEALKQSGRSTDLHPRALKSLVQKMIEEERKNEIVKSAVDLMAGAAPEKGNDGDNQDGRETVLRQDPPPPLDPGTVLQAGDDDLSAAGDDDLPAADGASKGDESPAHEVTVPAAAWQQDTLPAPAPAHMRDESPLVSPVASTSPRSPTPQCQPTQSAQVLKAPQRSGGAEKNGEDFGRLMVTVRHLHGHTAGRIESAMELAGKQKTNYVRVVLGFRGELAATKAVAVSRLPQDVERHVAIEQEVVFTNVCSRADTLDVHVYTAAQIGAEKAALVRQRKRRREAVDTVEDEGDHGVSLATALDEVHYLHSLPDEAVEHRLGGGRLTVGGRAEVGSVVVSVGPHGERVAMNWFYQYQPAHAFGLDLKFRTAEHLATGAGATKHSQNVQDTSNKTQTTLYPCLKVCSGGVPTVYTVSAKTPKGGITLDSKDVLFWGGCRVPVNTRRDGKVYISLWDEKRWDRALAVGSGNSGPEARDSACYGEIVLDTHALMAQQRQRQAFAHAAAAGPTASTVHTSPRDRLQGGASPVPPPSVATAPRGASPAAQTDRDVPFGASPTPDGHEWTWLPVQPPGVASAAVLAVEVVAYQERLRGTARKGMKLWEGIYRQGVLQKATATGKAKTKRQDVAKDITQARAVCDLGAQQRRTFEALLRHAAAIQLRLVDPARREAGATPFPAHLPPRSTSSDYAPWLTSFPLLLKGDEGSKKSASTSTHEEGSSTQEGGTGAPPDLLKSVNILKAAVADLILCAERRQFATRKRGSNAPSAGGGDGTYGPTAAIAKRIRQVVLGHGGPHCAETAPETVPPLIWLYQTLDYVLQAARNFVSGRPDIDALAPLFILLLSGRSVASAVVFEGEIFEPVVPSTAAGTREGFSNTALTTATGTKGNSNGAGALPAARGFANAAQFPELRCVEAGAETPIAIRILDGYKREVAPKHRVFLCDAVTHEVVEELRVGRSGGEPTKFVFRKAGTFYMAVRVEEVNYLTALLRPDGHPLTVLSHRFHVLPGPPEFLTASPRHFEATARERDVRPATLSVTDRCGNPLPAVLGGVSGLTARPADAEDTTRSLPLGAYRLSIFLKKFIPSFPWEVVIHGQPVALEVTARQNYTSVTELCASLKDEHGTVCGASRRGYWVKFVSIPADHTRTVPKLTAVLDPVSARRRTDADVMLGKAPIVDGVAKCEVVTHGVLPHTVVAYVCAREPAEDRRTSELLGCLLPYPTLSSTFSQLHVYVAHIDEAGVVDLAVRGGHTNDIIHPSEVVSVAAWDSASSPPDRLDEVAHLGHRTGTPLTLTSDGLVPSIILPYPSTFTVEVTMKGVSAKVVVEFPHPAAKRRQEESPDAPPPASAETGAGPRSPTCMNQPALIMDRPDRNDDDQFVQHIVPLASVPLTLPATVPAASRLRIVEGVEYTITPLEAEQGKEVGKAVAIAGIVVEAVDAVLTPAPPPAAPHANHHQTSQPGDAASDAVAVCLADATDPPCFLRVEVDLEWSAGKSKNGAVVLFEAPSVSEVGRVTTASAVSAAHAAAAAARGRKTVAPMDATTGQVRFPPLVLRNVTQYPLVLKFSATKESRVAFPPCYMAFDSEAELLNVPHLCIPPQTAKDVSMAVHVAALRSELPPYFAWFHPRRVAAAGTLSHDADVRKAQIAALRAERVHGIINLLPDPVTSDGELDAAGIRELCIPTPHERSGVGVEGLAKACWFIEDVIGTGDAPGGVLVMCSDGGARAGTVCAAWTMWARGKRAKEAVAEARSRRSGAVRSSDQEQQVWRFDAALKHDALRMAIERNRFSESDAVAQGLLPSRVSKIDRDPAAPASEPLYDLDLRIRLRFPHDVASQPPTSLPAASAFDPAKGQEGQWLCGAAMYRKKSSIRSVGNVVADPEAGIPQNAVIYKVAGKKSEAYKVKSDLMQAAIPSNTYEVQYAHYAEAPRQCLIEVRSCTTDEVLAAPFYTQLDPSVVDAAHLTYCLGSAVEQPVAASASSGDKHRVYLFRTRCSVGTGGWVYIRALCVASRASAVSPPVHIGHGTPAKLSIHPILTPATAGISPKELEALVTHHPGGKRMSVPIVSASVTASAAAATSRVVVPQRGNSGSNPCLVRAGATVEMRLCLADARGMVFPTTGFSGSAPAATGHDPDTVDASNPSAPPPKIMVRMVHCDEEEGTRTRTSDAVLEGLPVPDTHGLWWAVRVVVPKPGLYIVRATYVPPRVSPTWQDTVLQCPCGTPPPLFPGEEGLSAQRKAAVEGEFFVRSVLGEAVAVRYREHGVGGPLADHIGVIAEAVDQHMQPAVVTDDVKIAVEHAGGPEIVIPKGECCVQVLIPCGANPAAFRENLRQRVKHAESEGGVAGVWCESEVYCPTSNLAALPPGGFDALALAGCVFDGAGGAAPLHPCFHYNLPTAFDAAHFVADLPLVLQVVKRVAAIAVASAHADTVAVFADATLKTTDEKNAPLADEDWLRHRNKAIAKAYEHARRAHNPVLKLPTTPLPHPTFTIPKLEAAFGGPLPEFDPDNPPQRVAVRRPAHPPPPRTYGKVLASWSFTADTTSGEVINAFAVGGIGGKRDRERDSPGGSGVRDATGANDSPRHLRDAAAAREALLRNAQQEVASPMTVQSVSTQPRSSRGGTAEAASKSATAARVATKATRGRVHSIDHDKSAVISSTGNGEDTLFRRRLAVPGVLVTVFSAKGLVPATCIDETRHVYVRLVMGGDWAETQAAKRETLAPLIDSHFCFPQRLSSQVLKVQVFAKKKFTKHDQFLGEAFVNCGVKLKDDELAHGSFVLRARMAGRHAATDLAYLRQHQRYDYGTIQIAWCIQKPSRIGQRPHLKAHGQNIQIGMTRDSAVEKGGTDTELLYQKLIQRVDEYRHVCASETPQRISLGPMTDVHKLALARLARESRLELILTHDKDANGTSDTPHYALEGKEACFKRIGLPAKQVVLTCGHCQHIFCHEFFHFCQKTARSEQSVDAISHLKRVWVLEEADLPSYALRAEGFGNARAGAHNTKFTALVP